MKLFKVLSLMVLAVPGVLIAKDFRDYQELARQGNKEQIKDALDANSSADLSNVPVVEMLSNQVLNIEMDKLVTQKMMAKKQALQIGLNAKPAVTSPSVSPDAAAEAARVKALEDEVARLKAQLAQAQGGAAAGVPAISTGESNLSAADKLKLQRVEQKISGLKEDLAARRAINKSDLKTAYEKAEAASKANPLDVTLTTKFVAAKKKYDNYDAGISKAEKDLAAAEAEASAIKLGNASAGNNALAGIAGGATGLKQAETVVKDSSMVPASSGQKEANPMAIAAQRKAEEMAARRAAQAAAGSGSTSPVSTGSSSGSTSPSSTSAFGLPNRSGNRSAGSPVAATVTLTASDQTQLEQFISELGNLTVMARAKVLTTGIASSLPLEFGLATDLDKAKILAVIEWAKGKTVNDPEGKIAAWKKAANIR